MKGHPACLHLLEGMARQVDRREARSLELRRQQPLIQVWRYAGPSKLHRLPREPLPISSFTDPAIFTLILAPRSR